MRVFCSEPPKELNWELLAVFSSLEPYLLKVPIIAKVLRNRYRQVQVLHPMPPLTWHKDGLPRVLHSFDDNWQSIGALGPFSLLKPWQNLVEILDGLIVFTFLDQVLPTDQLLSDARAWWHKHPTFVPTDTRIPGWRRQRVLVYLTPWAPRSYQEPSMRWCSLLS